MDKRKCVDCGVELTSSDPGIAHVDRSVCVEQLRFECDMAKVESKANRQKWWNYEQDYILPTFKWAEALGFDLREAVHKQAGKNCVEVFFGWLMEEGGRKAKAAADETREECASKLEARAKELEPLEGKPDMVIWKHGLLTGLSAMIRKPS